MRRLALLTAVIGVAAFAVATGDATCLTALPVLGLFALLLDGRYVGADRLVARARRTPARRRTVLAAKPVARVVVRPYASALLGRRMARRGPPALLVV